MTSRAWRLLLQLGWACAAVSCTDGSLLGEDSCADVDAGCAADAPTLPVPLSMPEQQFDLIADEAPSLQVRELPSQGDWYGKIVPGPDGSMWVYILDDEGGALWRVTAEMQHKVDHTFSDWPDSLSVDSEGNPRFVKWNGDSKMRIAHVSRDGEYSEETVLLEGERSDARGPVGLSLTTEGDARVARFGPGGGYVAQHDRVGKVVWKQTHLRGAQRYPFEDRGPGTASPVSYGLLSLSDGSLAISLPKYLGDDRNEDDLDKRYQGITVLDRDGNVRWDAALMGITDAVSSLLLADGSDGALVIAASYPEVLRVITVDRTPSVVGNWTGFRTGYFAPSPLALCVDSERSAYIALAAGTRSAPRRMVCKLRSDDAPTPADCRDLELPAEYADPTESGASPTGVSMTCPAPDQVVVLVAGERDGENKALLMRLEL